MPVRPPLAIVGVSALFPGSVNKTGFWRNILSGADLLSDVPAGHWLVEDYYDPDPKAPGKTYARRGGFLPDVDFDALSWGVPPSIVSATDTSQLLALIVAQRVLEDATRGALGRVDRARTSVILGATAAQELMSEMVAGLQRPVWQKALRDSGLPEAEVQAACDRIADHFKPWQESTFPGLLGNVVAGRIANRLGLGGTNCVTDAACASTFSAVSMAVRELYLGDSDLVLCGGVDTMNDIFMYMCFSKTPAMSATGDCRPFSDAADGTMLGEGLGLFALRRLDDAERDGDPIYAVIRGVGSSSDGRSKSVYAPLPAGQARSIRRALAHAGYGPETVELVEAHGTGTKAGDAAEFEGLRTVFDESGRADRQWCALGSVKSQVGHTKAAAGAAGLFKAVMAVRHKVLPPTAKVTRPNPKLEVEASPFYLNTQARPWVRGADHPRRAGVSAFGFGGSNFHVSVEAYRGPTQAPRLRTWPTELVLVTGADGREVAAKARALADEATSHADVLPFLASRSRRAAETGAPARLAVLADRPSVLAERLHRAADALEAQPDAPFEHPDGTAFGLGAHAGQVAFVFPGQGSQYVGMGGDVACHFDAAIDAWDAAADLDLADAPLHHVVFPPPAFDDAGRAAQSARLTATEWAQPAIGCASEALLRLVTALGMRPDAVAGHSFGEVTALRAAGALSAADFMRVARVRGEHIAAAAEGTSGAMAAVWANAATVEALVTGCGAEVVLANLNHPGQTVISGPVAAVEAFERAARAAEVRCKRLNVATAFHSPVVAQAVEPFAASLAQVDFAAPTLPVFSNAEITPYAADADAVRARLAGAVARPVRFVEMIEAMADAGVRTFVEVGPGHTLTAMIKRTLGARPHAAVNLDHKGGDGVATLLRALGRLFALGVPFDPAGLDAGYRAPADPRATPAPKMAIAINGSNRGKRYPPEGGAAALPPPNPPRAEPTPAPAPIRVRPEPQPAPPVAAPQPRTEPIVTQHPGPHWLAAWQDAQRVTAQAHAAFQQAMAQAHTAYLQTAQQSFASLAALGGGAPAPQPIVMPAPQPIATPAPQPVVIPAPQPVVMPAPQPVATPAPQPVIPPPPPVAAPVIPVAPAPIIPAPAPSAAPAAPTDFAGLVRAVVAESTGYPAEMLAAEMDLEGDLGIDSIKRVEILSAVQERAPGLPDVDAAALASQRTLGDVIGYLAGLTGAPAPQPTSAVPVPAAAPPAGGAAIGDLLVAVIAEKTGYPAEMLTPEMELEGDLGVDSIKRVEILSAMQEQAPGLPDVDVTAMANLTTLGAMTDALQSMLAGAGEGASVPFGGPNAGSPTP